MTPLYAYWNEEMGCATVEYDGICWHMAPWIGMRPWGLPEAYQVLWTISWVQRYWVPFQKYWKTGNWS